MSGFPVHRYNPLAKNQKTQDRKRRRWGLLLILLAICLQPGSCAPKITKVYRVGILSGIDSFVEITKGYKEKMTALGYIEGQNIEYDYWKLNNDPLEEQRVIKKFVDEKVDLILTFPTRPSLAAKMATQETNIPVVFANAGIEGTDLVNSLREPGGNISGVRYPIPEITFKRLELLLEMAPKVKTLYITYDCTYPTYRATLKALHMAVLDKNLVLVEAPVTSVEELKADLDRREKMIEIGMDAIFIMPDLLTGSDAAWEVIQPFALKHNLPVAGTMDIHMNKAGLFLLVADYLDEGELAATISDKIFNGAPPGSIPVASPYLNLIINYQRAQELGLTIPEGLLKQAYQVIH